MENTNQLSYFKGEDHPALINETIGQRLADTVARFPDHDALIVRHQGIRWTYAEFRRQVDRLATGLLALDIQPGDRVGVWGPNSYEWVLTQLTTARIGAGSAGSGAGGPAGSERLADRDIAVTSNP